MMTEVGLFGELSHISLAFLCHVFRDRVQIRQKTIRLCQRHDVRYATGKARSDRIDRIAGTRNEDNISRIDEGKMDVANPFLRADQGQDFVGRIKRDIESALVPIRHGFAK